MGATGFVTGEETGKEDKLLAKLWQCLAGEEKDHVTLNNARMMCLAIQGILIDHAADIDRSG